MQSQMDNQSMWNKKMHYHEKDTLSRIFTGLLVIWLGITFYMNNMGWLDGAWWAYFVMGIGVLFLIETLVRISQNRQYPMYGKLIGGIVLIAVGANNIYGINDWWPLIFVAAGLAIIFMNTRQHDDQQQQLGE
ncbi:hypothetical protein JW960_12875 [candidate division KSB1 bacterium]|nr:hypothetical protein [candidate division KSB1 bacterium]